MKHIVDIFTNYILMSAVCSWLVAQILKGFTGVFKLKTASSDIRTGFFHCHRVRKAVIDIKGGLPDHLTVNRHTALCNRVLRLLTAFGITVFKQINICSHLVAQRNKGQRQIATTPPRSAPTKT